MTWKQLIEQAAKLPTAALDKPAIVRSMEGDYSPVYFGQVDEDSHLVDEDGIVAGTSVAENDPCLRVS